MRQSNSVALTALFFAAIKRVVVMFCESIIMQSFGSEARCAESVDDDLD